MSISCFVSADEVEWSEKIVTDIQPEKTDRPRLQFSPGLKSNSRNSEERGIDSRREIALKLARVNGVSVSPNMSTIEILRRSLKASQASGRALHQNNARLRGQQQAELERYRSYLRMQEFKAQEEFRASLRKKRKTKIDPSKTVSAKICGDIEYCSSEKSCGDIDVCMDSSKECDTVEACSYDGASCFDVYVCKSDLL